MVYNVGNLVICGIHSLSMKSSSVFFPTSVMKFIRSRPQALHAFVLLNPMLSHN